MLRTLLAAALLAFVAVAPVAAQTTGCPTPTPTPTPPPENPAEPGLQAALEQINALRRQAGVAPLALESRLTAAAQKHSEWMQANNRLSHTGEGGSSPWQRAMAEGYRYSSIGENVAAGQADWQAAINAWMRSSGHRANLLNARYVHIGLGGAGRYYTALMAAPR